MSDNDKLLAPPQPALSRRRFVGTTIGATVGALVLPLLPPRLLAAQPTADATTAINADALYTLSQKLVGSDDIARNRVDQLAGLIENRPQLRNGLSELFNLDDPTSEKAQASLSASGHGTCTNILTYWYQGYFNGQPIAQRSDVFFGLPAWATVGYMTQPTMCKGYGYWAQDVTSDADTAEAPA